MADRNHFRSLLNDNFKSLTWVLILFIAITPNFIFIRSANAANLGGWNISNPVSQGASTVYNATKNVVINGKNFIKQSSVKITPTASQVAKVLARGAAGYALSVAVQQLLGSVDWVLDPANNQIRYTKPLDPNQRYVYPFQGVNYTGPDAVCNAYFALQAKTSIKLENKKVTINNNGASVLCTASQTYKCYGGTQECKDNLRYEAYRTAIIDGPTEEEKTLPLDVVAQQVISNAAGGDTAAQAATTAAAADIVAEAEKDNTKARPIASQAEANATTKPADAAEAEKANEAQGQSKPNTQNPEAMDLSLEFPVFCGWAPLVCEAAQVVISFPQTLTNWWDTANQKASVWAASISQAWTDAKKWATENYTDTESNKVTIEQDNNIIFDDSQRFNFGNTCPTSEQFSVSFSGITQNLEFSYQPLCQFMSMIKPFVIAGSYLMGAYIVMGLSRGSSD